MLMYYTLYVIHMNINLCASIYYTYAIYNYKLSLLKNVIKKINKIFLLFYCIFIDLIYFVSQISIFCTHLLNVAGDTIES